jgi:N-carbamoyl-D-amino-acid hydrolase
MSRIITVAAAQLGPISRDEPRQSAVARMCALMREAKDRGAELVVFPELALTTFFPRWHFEDQSEIDVFFERAMPNPAVQPLFDLARDLEVGFNLGYAELTPEGRHFNTSVLVDRRGEIVGKYRKVHLPGHRDNEPWRPFQHLEKRYFETGDLGFPVFEAFGGRIGLCICNDRRWPETWRMLGLQGVELVALGFNTPSVNSQKAEEGPAQRAFQHRLSMQAGAYQNATWAVAVAKCGVEDGHPLMGGTMIVDPNGAIVVEAKTEDDELVVADCDLNATRFGKQTVFDFARHRRPEHYGRITAQTGATPPKN